MISSVLSLILLLVPLTGMVLGFSALRDIREANGRLGGAMLATFAAGLLPALLIVAACAAGLTLLVEAISPSARARSELFLVLGSAGGVWLSFLMMRGMYRQATGWVPPASAGTALSRPATAALILTIMGGLLIFTYFSRPDNVRVVGMWTPRELVIVNLALLTAGLICGVIARAETTGKVCAWICGGLFFFLMIAHT
jgi:hypothetical protein